MLLNQTYLNQRVFEINVQLVSVLQILYAVNSGHSFSTDSGSPLNIENLEGIYDKSANQNFAIDLSYWEAVTSDEAYVSKHATYLS